MASYTRQLLSGSTDGLPIKIAASATPGTTIHTASATAKDEIYLWVANTDSSDWTMTVEWGSATDPDGLLCKTVTVPANCPPTQFAFGQVLTNSKVVKIFASAANVLTVTGYVNRIA